MRKHQTRPGLAAVLALVIAAAAAMPAMTAGPFTYRAYAAYTGEIDAGMDLEQISKFGNI